MTIKYYCEHYLSPMTPCAVYNAYGELVQYYRGIVDHIPKALRNREISKITVGCWHNEYEIIFWVGKDIS